MKTSSEVFSFPIKHTDHIKNKSNLRLLQCSICQKIKSNVYRCKSCHQSFCVQCAQNHKSIEDRCPNCDISYFQIEQIPRSMISYNCPYNPQKCKVNLLDIQQFKDHCLTCFYITYYNKVKHLHQQLYQCLQGHSLIYINNDICCQLFLESRKQGKRLNIYQCSACLAFRFAVSFCQQCSTIQQDLIGFCKYCRPLPCTRTLCPYGHQLTVNNKPSLFTNCDVCGIGINVFNQKCLSCRSCDFDICSKCICKLPLKNNLVPLNNQFSKYFPRQLDPDICFNKSIQTLYLSNLNQKLPIKSSTNYLFLNKFIKKKYQQLQYNDYDSDC